MKWLALALILLNGLIWFVSDRWVPERLSVMSGQQTLPRVADLKLQSGAEAAPKEEPPAGAENVTGPEPDTEVAEVAEQEAGAAEQSSANSEMPLPAVESQCVELGWFDSLDLARQAYQSLGKPGSNMRTIEVERILQPLHWVIIPPQPESQALEKFRELQRRGIDSYLVTEGENQNAISLGLFQSLEAARNVLAQKKRQNLNAVLAKFPRNQISYALVFEAIQSADSAAGKARIRDFQNDFEMVEIGPCEGIATTPENP